MFALVSEKIRNNDRDWFKIFASSKRRMIEEALIEHKTIITLLISALASSKRVAGGKNLISYIVETIKNGEDDISPDAIAAHLGLQSRLYSIQSKPGADFSEDAKSSAFLRDALKQALRCPLCEGFLDPSKSVSYDHIKRKQDGGLGDEENCQATHPYCNSVKS